MMVVRSKTYLAKYATTMRRMWAHPGNDQRPAVLHWLQSLGLPCGSAVLDIGCGDAYYLHLLRPRLYVGVDPNTALTKDAAAKARDLGATTRIYTDLNGALSPEAESRFGLKLMLHSLLYLDLQEAQIAMSAFPAASCIVVHPLPSASTTIQFERSVGIHVAESLVACKERILGKPLSFKVAQTHLCFQDSLTSDEDLAFIVAHRAFPYGDFDEIETRSLTFVQEHRPSWTHSGIVRVPQWQIMEFYSF